MRAHILAAALLSAACSGTPTDGGEPPPMPTGTILVATPNGAESGTYLVDIATGNLTKLATRRDPLTVALSGGYSAAGHFVYGTNATTPRRIMRLPLAGGAADTLLAIPVNHSLGTYRLSPDGRTMAVQTATLEVQLWTVDLETGTWTQRIDRVASLDTVPLTSLRWSPDGRSLLAVTENYPHPSALVRMNLQDDRFDIISPTTPINISPWIDISPDGDVIAHGEAGGNLVFRDRNGAELGDYPNTTGLIGRPIFSPDGKFVAYEEFGSPPDFQTTIMLMRLADGERWPLQVDAEFEVWLSDWIPGGEV